MPPGADRWGRRGLTVLACACAGSFLLALAYRPVASVDLGYHLSCGRAFWQSGHIVQEDTFIAPPLDPADADRGDLLPGSTFDPNGQYHFPNANWLSQVILAGLWAAGGWTAMNVTLVVCVAVIGLAQMVMVRRLGIPLGWLAPIWLMTGLVAHERFMVRPELFIYLCLIGQLCLVLGPMTWRAVAAVVSDQHSDPGLLRRLGDAPRGLQRVGDRFLD